MSDIVTATELDQLRADSQVGLLDHCRLRRRGPDGWVDTTSPDGVPCRLHLGDRSQVETPGAVAGGIDADGTLRLPADIDVLRGDRAHVTGLAGETIAEVVHVPPHVRAHRNALVRLVESAT